MGLSPASFRFIRDFARDSAAIVLEPGKEYLVEARLTPLATQAGCRNLDDYIQRLRAQSLTELQRAQALDALTTNETSFFRDAHPFDTLRQHIVPKLITQRATSRKLAIWSAASSTGQEPYSIAMLLQESFPQLQEWNVSILATDLSSTVLKYARAGLYTQLEVNRGLPAPYLVKYFSRRGDKWAVQETLKKWVEFRSFNLIKPWPILPVFDVVFMRNVMIYFDLETKRTILTRLRPCLHPAGYLFLGTAETTMNLDHHWNPVTVGKAVAYQNQIPEKML